MPCISAAKPKTEKLNIQSEILATLSGKALFYPCSGMDFKEPLAWFSPWIQDFYFVDKGYFCPGDQDMKSGSMGLRAYRLRPVLTGRAEYQLKEIRITGDVESDAYRVPEIDPVTDSCWVVPPVLRTEIYVHLQTAREVRLHFWRNDSVTALSSLTNTMDLGVFFYRADSMGEGGSGVMWMQHRLISQVLSQLADRGLLVTDGSQHDGLGWAQDRGPALAYRDLWRYREQGGVERAPIECGDSFTDDEQRVLRCVGYSGSGKSRTIAWQLDKSNWTPGHIPNNIERSAYATTK